MNAIEKMLRQYKPTWEKMKDLEWQGEYPPKVLRRMAHDCYASLKLAQQRIERLEKDLLYVRDFKDSLLNVVLDAPEDE